MMLLESSNIDNRPLYNSRIISTYIKLIKIKYSYINIGELLSYAKMELHQIEDEGHWFTQEQINLFYEKVEKLTGNKNIAKEAGRYSASPEAIGMMRQYILGFVGIGNAYELVGKYVHNFTKSSIYKSKKINPIKVEITVTPKEGVEEKLFQCESRIGYWEAIAVLFNHKLPKVEHPECMFRGEKSCRYIISWRKAQSDLWEKIRNYTALSLFAIIIDAYFLYPTLLPMILAISVPVVLFLTLYSGHIKGKELNSAINSLRGSSDRLLEHVDLNYNNALLINDIGLAISKQRGIDGILKEVVNVLEKRLDYDRGAIFVANKDKTRLIFHNGFGYNYEQFKILENSSFNLSMPESKGPFAVSFREQRPFLVNNVEEIKDTITLHSLEFARQLGTKSFICCPVIYEDESLGILAVDNIKTKRPLRQSDMNLLMGIAPEVGIAIYNARLMEAKEHQLRSMIQAMAATIDARDFLTAGHSEKVAKYAVGICKEMGMSEEYSEMIRISSLLHDYGKIGIADSVLKKDGRLTSEEYEEIKTHAEKTKKILEQVDFDGIYREVPVVAAYHHEKIDGSGYPEGLKGEEIPLGARILAVADFFDAVTSKRHYRNPMNHEEALGLLKKGNGIHFDSTVVEAFIRYDNYNGKG